ncbi:MAG: GGDEF domain-containing protein [Clostridia bacterium]
MKKLDQYLSSKKEVLTEGQISRQLLLLYISLPLLIVIPLLFAIINYYEQLYLMASIDLGASLFALFSIIYLNKTGKHKVVSYLATSIFMMTLIALYFTMGFVYYSLSWSSVFIIVSFALFGRKKGLYISLTFFVLTSASAIYHFQESSMSNFSFISFSNIFFANILIFIICYYYEYSIEIIQDRLKDNNKKLKSLAIIDKLTGLYNRSEIDKKIISELEKANKKEHSFSILIADLDDFKEINDEQGHLLGDEVMKQVAEVFNEVCGEDYFAGRWGGDEFLIILPDTNRAGAYHIAENIRQKISQTSFSKEQKLTTSLAVTEYQKGDTPITIFRRVDNLLYKAKNRGKNTTIIA